LSGPIDLRSDTVTRPTEAMLDAMSGATLDDDSRDGDATVRRLEALAAERMGKEAAMFVPSGTMANLVSVLAHTHRGGQVILEATSHILRSELGGIAAIGGAFHKALPGERGAMNIDRLRDTIQPPGRHATGTQLVCVETTHNDAGGAVLPLAHMQAVHAIAADNDVAVHIDGARVFNAAAALHVDAATIARYGDSVAFCVSKGLSAPIGSLVCGTTAFIERARAFRRMVGGNMRQAGLLAAAGILALDTMVARLGEDHATAKRLANALHTLDPDLVSPAAVETNIVRVELPRAGRSAADWCVGLREHRVLVAPCDKYGLRFVTHRHIGSNEIDHAARAFAKLWRDWNYER
jgi:threonine aldolase